MDERAKDEVLAAYAAYVAAFRANDIQAIDSKREFRYTQWRVPPAGA